MKKRISTLQNLVLTGMAFLAVVGVVVQARFGVAQKWHAALAWTLVPFSVVITPYRRYWASWRFWVAFYICLAVHIMLMWLIFAVVFAKLTRLGTIYVIPFEFIELLVLVIVIALLMRLLGHPDRYIRIT